MEDTLGFNIGSVFVPRCLEGTQMLLQNLNH